MSNHLLLDELNEAQHQAVTTTEGAILILAGAGSGKTRVLTKRFAYLVQNGKARAEEILAVTFTNKAALEMKNRVHRYLQIDPQNHSRFWVGTFHSTGAKMLRIHGHILGYDQNFTILDTSDQERLIKRILENDSATQLVYWTPPKLVAFFARCKDDHTTPAATTATRYPNESNWLTHLFSEYQNQLEKSNAMDFSDLLLNCLKLWDADPEILANYQERFRYLLVDEFQDTNRVQYLWLQKLAGRHGNLCVVGDDDQSIYSWRGACLDNLLDFRKDYPDCQIIRLEQNYRSTGNILNLASQLIDKNKDRMGKTLWTATGSGPPVEIFAAMDGEQEAQFVANEILAQTSNNRSHDHFAVLVRASRQTRLIEEALMRHRIPFKITGGLRFLERAEIKDAIAYLRIVHSDRDDMALERIINIPRRGIGPTTLHQLAASAQANHTSMLIAARGACHGKGLSQTAKNKLTQLLSMIDQARSMIDHEPLTVVLQFLLDNSGYLDYLEREERAEDKKENLGELLGYLEEFTSLEEMLERTVLDGGRHQPDSDHGQPSVTLSTLHAAKGLEFPVVFLVGLEEGLLPHAMAVKEEGGLEEERRLLYVGITRAQERLLLSHARRRRLGYDYQSVNPSRFLAEMPTDQMVWRKNPYLTTTRGIRTHFR